jgi:hypothetical protein
MKHSCWIFCAVAVLIVGFGGLELLAQAADPLIGTWELNVAKSTSSPGPPPKSSTRTFVQDGNGYKYTNRGIDADGKPYLVEYTAHFDGKDYPITGDSNADTISMKRIDRFTIEFTSKKAGKVSYTSKRVTSQDGKTSTVTAQGTDAQGKPFKNVLVFDKK